MKIFGQPADYSEMLQRITWFTLATGLICTALLAKASPAMNEVIESFGTEADVGPVKGIKVLYVLIPGVLAVIFRVLKLHDRISDLLRIRFHFDTEHLLFPLCQGAGSPLAAARKAAIRKSRNDSMYQVFYKYAGFKEPIIDSQLVRTAADNWGWFWVLVESASLFIVTAIILAFMREWGYLLVCVSVIVFEVVLLLYLWAACKKSAGPQVKAILDDGTRKLAIRNYFDSLTCDPGKR